VNTLLIYLLFWFVIFPALTFLHEIGHAIPVLFLTKKDVMIVLGGKRTNISPTNTLTLELGRIRFTIFPTYFWGGFYFSDASNLTTFERVIIILGGPVASLLIAIIIWFLDMSLQPDLGTAFDSLPPMIGLAAFIQFLMTIIPIKYPAWLPIYGGMSSDGYRALHTFRIKDK